MAHQLATHRDEVPIPCCSAWIAMVEKVGPSDDTHTTLVMFPILSDVSKSVYLPTAKRVHTVLPDIAHKRAVSKRPARTGYPALPCARAMNQWEATLQPHAKSAWIR